MNSHIKNRLAGILESLESAYRAGNRLPSASKGFEREVVVQGLLEAVFPTSYRFGTGYAVHQLNEDSTGQLDIVIETSYGVSLPISGSHVRLYPVDSIAAVLEVKSDLTKQMAEARATCSKLRKLFKSERLGAVEVLHSQIAEPGTGSFGMLGGYRADVKAALWEVPLFVVGFLGPAKIETLADYLRQSGSEGPDGIFAVNTKHYVVRPRTAARSDITRYEDEEALLAFIFDIERAVLQFASHPATFGGFAGISL